MLGMSMLKSILGALGVPVMFMMQLTLMLLLEKLLPICRSERLTELTIYCAVRFRPAL